MTQGLVVSGFASPSPGFAGSLFSGAPHPTMLNPSNSSFLIDMGWGLVQHPGTVPRPLVTVGASQRHSGLIPFFGVEEVANHVLFIRVILLE